MPARSIDRRVRVTAGFPIGFGVVGGLAATGAGVRPTGSVIIDAVWLILAMSAVAWAGADAPLATLAGLAGLDVVLAAGNVERLATSLLLIVTAWHWWRQRSGAHELSRQLRSALTVAAFLGLTLAGATGPFGLTSAIGVISGATLVTWAAVRSWGRRAVIITIAAGLAAAVLAAGLLTLAGVGARGDLTAGRANTDAGLGHLRSGDFSSGRAAFAAANDDFAEATRKLTRPWLYVARLVPVLAQHHRAGVALTEAGQNASGEIERQLSQIDPDALRLSDGRVDVAAISALREPLTAIDTTLGGLDTAIDRAASRWLLPPVARRLDAVDATVDRQRGASASALRAIDLAPDLLGASQVRRYFVMFTTPAEARGQGGFMANYAIVTIDAGKIEIGEVARTQQLNDATASPRYISGPAEWLDRYGRYGFANGPGGSTREVPWSNITISPQFPSTGAVVAELYPQSGGATLDGVFSLDVEALAALLGIVGPVQVDGWPTPLDATNLAQFLLLDQYRITGTERVDLLGTIADTVARGVLDGAGTDPFEIGRAMAPLANEGRVLAWSADSDEQALFAQLGLDGAVFPNDLPPASAAFSVRVVNSSASKIDSFLERSVCLAHTSDGITRAVIELTNTAPAAGLPDYVIGNEVGLPIGTSRLIVSWYTTIPVSAVTVGGQPIELQQQREAGAWVYDAVVTLAAGERVEIDVTYQPAGDPPTGLFVAPQPLVVPERWGLTEADATECELSLVESPRWIGSV